MSQVVERLQFISADRRDIYTVMINPESYEHDHLGTGILSFELVIDGTGIVDPTRTDVPLELEYLRNVLFHSQGDNRVPKTVNVVWASLDFKGRVSGFSTNYTVFRPDGNPLRAKVAITLIGHSEAPLNELEESVGFWGRLFSKL